MHKSGMWSRVTQRRILFIPIICGGCPVNRQSPKQFRRSHPTEASYNPARALMYKFGKHLPRSAALKFLCAAAFSSSSSTTMPAGKPWRQIFAFDLSNWFLGIRKEEGEDFRGYRITP
jgi:hypothetical protein